MNNDRDDLLRHFRDSRTKLLAAIDGLTDEQMSERSLDGWSVNDHLGHLAMWDELRGSEVERISAGFDSAWKMTDEQDDALNAMTYEMRRSMTPAQARWEVERSRQRLLDAIQSAPAGALDPSRYGTAGLHSDHEDAHAGWIQRWRDEKGF